LLSVTFNYYYKKTKLSSGSLRCKSRRFKQQISKFHPLIQHTVIEIQQFNAFQNCSHLPSRIFTKKFEILMAVGLRESVCIMVRDLLVTSYC